VKHVPEARVRAAIARHVLGSELASGLLGSVTLHAHQREGAGRARDLLATRRGALVADDVGLGKTYLALAVAREYRSPLVAAPASLRHAWLEASARAAVPVHFASIERLGRGAWPGGGFDLVIIDEAHNLRNAATRRFAAARTLCATAPVLLLTATPVQNHVADLRAVMSLFLGEQAQALSVEELSQLIIRRDASHVPRSDAPLPAVDAPRWLHWGEDVDCLARILALPPPVSASDDGDGGMLLTWSLVRQWASSRAALVAALTRRLARARALEDALSDGRLPTRAELAAWCCADGEQQMAFAFMASAGPSWSGRLLDDVHAHAAGLRALLAGLAATADPDAGRAAALASLTRESRGRRVIAFSEHAATIERLYRLVAPGVQAAMLTHAGGRVVGGRLARRDVLARFQPGARVPSRDRIDVLLTTDVLSEGVSLHDASIVVHLDLPWNPARLAQRVGRVRRLGSAATSVSVFALAPPAPAERMLELGKRLAAKLDHAAVTVGVAGDVLPDAGPGVHDPAAARRERIVAAVARWRGDAGSDALVRGAARASRDGWIACVRSGGRVRLLAGAPVVSDSLEAVEAAVASVAAGDADARPEEFDAALERVQNWVRSRGTTDVIDLPARRSARARRRVLLRLDGIGERAPRHARPLLAPMLRTARAVATAELSAGAEDVLDELAGADMADAAWLQAVAQFASINARAGSAEPEVLALLLLRRDPARTL